MNYLEYVDFLMDEFGIPEEKACQIADLEFSEESYDADDYV